MSWMIYGATGYTGELIARHAVEQGEKPVLAGRNADKVEKLANELSLPFKVFSLDSVDTIAEALNDIELVVHCAGPFEITAEPMLKACVQSKTHYLDITGEISVFERAHGMSEQAKEAGIVICPGVGFDVIPTDCIASQLKEELPTATHLKLGFDSRSRMSRGTAKTSVMRLGEGGAVRKDGKITPVPLAYKSEWIDFGSGKKKLAMTIPWGDVSTAFYSTGIPNIEVYIPASPRLVKQMKRMNWFRWLLKTNFAQNYLMKQVDKQPEGPTDEERAKLYTWVWGEASDEQGNKAEKQVKVMNGYHLTYLGAVKLALFVLNNDVPVGATTPSKMYGNQLINEFLQSD